MQSFKCNLMNEEGITETWDGEWREICEGPGPLWEIQVRARGSLYDLIVGCYSGGNYLCIPLLDIGCGLSYLQDTYWNFNKLAELLPAVDAKTIAEALSCFSRY
mgnify:CR=1 FL=1